MKSINAARNVLLVLVVLAALGGATFAAARVMDGGTAAPSEIRAKRAKETAAAVRKEQKARKRRGGAPLPAAAAPAVSGPRSRRRWASRANALCDRTYAQIVELVETSPVATPQDVLRLFDASLAITDRFVVRLRRLGPAPDRRAHARLLRELDASQAADRQSVRALRARWSQAALTAALRESARRADSLRALAERLDAVACSQLFDPVRLG